MECIAHQFLSCIDIGVISAIIVITAILNSAFFSGVTGGLRTGR